MRWPCWLGVVLVACGSAPSMVPPGPDASGDGSADASVPPRVAALDPSRYGLNSHNAGEPLLGQFAAVGIKWHRIDINWFDVEPARGDYRWDVIDSMFAAADQHGLSIFGVIAYAPPWANGGGSTAAPPTDPADYIAFVRQVVRRYAGRMDCASIWNEPNLSQFWSGTKTQFINDIFVPGLIAVRQEAPEMVTCGPDLSSSGNERANWLAPILDAAAPHLDVITQHTYDGGDTVSGRVADIDALHQFLVARSLGAVPLWITETGVMRGSRFTEATQATFLRDMMAAMTTRAYWNKTFWYDSHGAGWGVLGADATVEAGVPNASYYAYRDAILAAP